MNLCPGYLKNGAICAHSDNNCPYGDGACECLDHKRVFIVHVGGNHFTICSGEPDYGEHYDVTEELKDKSLVTVEWIKAKAQEGKVVPPFNRWHCTICRPDGDKDCNCSHCKTKK